MQQKNEDEKHDIEGQFTPKQRFFIKLLVSIVALIYAIIELIRILKNV